MRIGFDLDDTLTNIENKMLKEAIKYDITLRNEGIVNKDTDYISYFFNWNDDERKYFLSVVRRKIVDEVKPRRGVKKYLNKLKKEGHKIFIITARSDIYYDNNSYGITKKWLDKNNIPYDKLLVNAGTKKEVCENEKIDIFVDDRVKNLEEVAKSKTKVLLFNIKANKDIKNNFIRVNNYKEIYNYIQNFSQN